MLYLNRLKASTSLDPFCFAFHNLRDAPGAWRFCMYLNTYSQTKKLAESIALAQRQEIARMPSLIRELDNTRRS